MTDWISHAAWKARAGPVAIVGIGCRFPGGVTDAGSFWQLLSDGRDAITEIPQSRIDIGRYFDPQPATPGRIMTRWGGFLDHIDAFDAAFFRISPREAERMDPQQRLLLETAWEAFEDAGQDLTRLRTARAGVYVGQWLSDFEGRLFGDPEAVDFQMTTGSGRYASSGRISYALGLNGPSLTLDTACSSSLVAVHLAVRAIRSGECEVALAGGVNVILQPHISIAYSQSRMMAADGRCKFGDARADGYVRSEGAGLVVLKPLEQAVADGDRIYAVIHGSATNNDGCSSGSMGTPSRSGQEDLLRAAYADAGRSIGDVGYFEAHGTGTRVGDPVELGAIAAVIGESGAAHAPEPAYVGSVKTGIGHTEGAAGIAGLIKTALALHRGTIPPSLHCDQLNPAIAWDDFPCAIARAATPWPTRGGERLAGVSAFGISGSNAHVVLGEAPHRDAAAAAPPAAMSPAAAMSRAAQVLPLSARSATALRQLAGDYQALLASDAASLRDVCRSAATRRTPQDYRMAFVAADTAGMIEELRRFADDTADVAPVADEAPRVAFVIPGQGGQWIGMARELMRSEPVFLAALNQCDDAIGTIVDWSIVKQLAAEPGTDAFELDRIDVIQPVLVAVAIAYAALWRSLGVEPDAVVGHSMGEVGAACISGALDLPSAMRIVCLRSSLMRRASGHGAMALVDLPIEKVTQRLSGHEDKVSVAAANGPRSVVISGEPEAVKELLAQFERDNIFSRPINVDVASHSPQMQPLAEELAAGLAGLAPQPARIAFYSTVLGRRAEGEELGADYWARNIRQPVLFGATMRQMLSDGINTVIELGPHPVLLHSVHDVAQSCDRRVTAIGSGRREEPEQASLLAGIGALWAAGYPVEWQRLMPENGRSVALPRHPWNRTRHWAEAAELRAASADAAHRPVALDDEMRGWLHRLQWIDAGGTEREPLKSAVAAQWLIACDDAGLTGTLAAQLARDNATISITTLAHLETAVAALAIGGAPVGIVLVLPDTAAAGYLPLRLLQAVEESNLRTRIWVVSRGAQSVGAERVSAHQAAAWGAARVVAQEHPDLWGGLIDLDPSQTTSDAALLFASQLLQPDDENQIAFRNGRRFVLRIVEDDDSEARVTPYAWRRDAAYLITGGLGEVGLQIADAMALAGARRLILVGRTPLPPRETWGSLPPDDVAGRRVAAIRALEQAGVAVHVAAVDVGDEQALRGFLARYAAEGWPKIAGVVHAAGRFDNHLAGTMTAAQFDAAVAPKLHGAQHLDALLPDLDLFVMFSSTGAFQVQAGQANYAAANAGLDALAQDRRARGLPAQSIAWGVWENTGLVNNDAGRLNVAEMARQGIGSFAPERGAMLFGWLCARDIACPVVLPVDWARFKTDHRASGDPLYRSVLGDMRLSAVDLPQQLLAADAAESRRLLDAVVRDAVGKVLKLTPAELDPRRTLGSMGLSSLMAIELRNRLEAALGRSLSATLAWNYPTVATLVAHLAGVGDAPPAQPPQRAILPLPDHVTGLAELSDEEALAALRA